jgi:hypothetical protein
LKNGIVMGEREKRDVAKRQMPSEGPSKTNTYALTWVDISYQVRVSPRVSAYMLAFPRIIATNMVIDQCYANAAMLAVAS